MVATLTNLKLQDFRREVEKLFENGTNVSTIIERYSITSKSNVVEGKPSRATLYNWFNSFVKRTNSKGGNFDKNGQQNQYQTAKGQGNVGSERPEIEITSGTPPEHPDQQPEHEKKEKKDKDDDEEELIDPDEVMEFDMLGHELPKRFKEGLMSRGITEDDLAELDYERVEATQKRTTPKMIKKYLPIISEYALEFNFVTSYLLPSIDAGLLLYGRKQGTKEKKEEKDKAVPSVPNPFFSNFTTNIGEVSI